MEVPAQIKAAAQVLINIYGDAFDYLGKYEGADAYLYRFPDNASTGLPYIYLFKNGITTEITGFEALDLLNVLVGNLDENKVE